MNLFEQYIDTHFILWRGVLLVRYAYVDRPGRCAALCRWAYWRGLRFEWVHDGGYELIDWAARYAEQMADV